MAASVEITAENRYITRGRNALHAIFERHFDDSCDQYDAKYAAIYGMYRLKRIQQIGERFSMCGDCRQGVARIRCTNPECGHDYFRPFSCKEFYLCPSCSRKLTIPFAGLLSMVKVFRRRVIKFLIQRELLNEDFARNFLS